MRRRAVIAIVLGAVTAWLVWWRPIGPPTGPAPVALDDGWSLSTPAAQGFDPAELDRASRRLLDGPFNVHSVLVERHGRLVAESYRGGRDRSVWSLVSIRHSFNAETRHDVRSISKSVTSLLYGIALAEGRVPAPERQVSTVFPDLEGAAFDNARQMRVRDLLDMSTGLEWEEGSLGLTDEVRMYWRPNLPRFVLDRPLATRPGTAFHYNGGATALLSRLIAGGMGMPVDRFAEERLFEPLGIVDWEWARDVHGRPMAFNGLRLRPRDLLKIGLLVRHHGRWNGRQLVPAAWIEDSGAPGAATGIRDFHYRAQWWQGTVHWNGRQIPWRAGFGNGGQRLFVIPDLDLVAVTTAGAYDEMPTAAAVNRFLQELASSVVR